MSTRSPAALRAGEGPTEGRCAHAHGRRHGARTPAPGAPRRAEVAARHHREDVRRLVRTASLAGAVLAAACGSFQLGGSRSPPAGQEAALRLWIDSRVRWDVGADRHLDVAIENGTTRSVSLAEPDPAQARVGVFPGPDNLRVCGIDPREGVPDARPRITLPPGGSVTFRVDLDEACRDVPPGEYRIEVDYRSPPADGGPGAFSGAFATRYGVVDVVGGPSGAQAERSTSERPRAGRAPPRRSPIR